MAKVYANRVMMGKIGIMDVPESLRLAVIQILIEKGFMEGDNG